MTEAGDTSVLRTGRFLLYDEKPNRKNANAFTLLARMSYEYVLMKKSWNSRIFCEPFDQLVTKNC